MIWMRPSRPFLGDAVVLARIIGAGRGIFCGFVDGRPSGFCCSLWNLFCHEQHEFLTGLSSGSDDNFAHSDFPNFKTYPK